MADPITLSVLAVGVGTNLLSNVIDRRYCDGVRLLRRKFLDEMSLPGNHDLARTVRRAQLLALRLTVKGYRALPHPAWSAFPGYSKDDIDHPLSRFARREIFSGVRQSADVAVQTRIEGELEHVFAHPAPTEAPAAGRQAAFRALCENWTLAEVRGLVRNAKDWPRFEALFRRGGPVDGAGPSTPAWWTAFQAFLGEMIKDDPRVARILTQQQLSEILGRQADARLALEDLRRGQQALLDAVGPALAGLAGAEGQVKAALDRFDRAVEALLPALTRVVEESQQRWQGVFLKTGAAVIDPQRLRDRPTELLIARYRVAPFIDRDDLLEGLLAWARDASGRRARGRLYCAPGGFGKTRLAIELIDRLNAQGWRCAFLSQSNASDLAPGALPNLLEALGTQGVCVVLDYAEGQVDRLKAVAQAAERAMDGGGHPIRIVALARSAAGWWEAVAEQSQVLDLQPSLAVARPLDADMAQRLFDRTREAFAARLPEELRSARPLPVDSILGGWSPDRPLVAAAAAYLAARGVATGEESVFETLYKEERLHWRRLLKTEDDAPEVDDLARLAAQVTLIQGAQEAALEALAAADPSPRVLGAPSLTPHLRRLYGYSRAGDDTDRWIGAIEPDLLGEHAAMRIAGAGGRELVAPTLVAALRGAPLHPADPGLILTVMARATRPEHDPRVRQGAEAAEAALVACCARLDLGQARRLEAALPETSSLHRPLAVAVIERALALLSKVDDVRKERARLLNNLGIRLSELGRWPDAHGVAAEATRLYRELVEADRDTFLPQLAMSLSNLGVRRAQVGLRTEAHEASVEAVGIYRELVAVDRESFLSDLAMSLGNLANRLSDLGAGEEAYEAGAEAAEIYRELAITDREESLSYLAAALNNLGSLLSNLKRREEAYEAASEAVNIRRELVATNRDAYLPNLASSLSNLGNRLSDLKQKERAHEATEEAVQIYRELVAANRDAFLSDLATSLNNLGGDLSALERHTEAYDAASEAVTIRRELTMANPGAFLPSLAMSLGAFGAVLRHMGRHIEAATAFLEGVETISPPAKAWPQAFGGLMQNLASDYVKAALAAGVPEREIVDALKRTGFEPSLPGEDA